MKKKRVMALVLSCIMAGSLVACGGGANQTASEPARPAQTEEAEEPAEAPAKRGKRSGSSGKEKKEQQDRSRTLHCGHIRSAPGEIQQ